jgi:hypothetical protein
MPVLPKQGKGGHQASARSHGEEASGHRGEEGSKKKSTRGARQVGAGTEIGRGETKVMGLLVPKEPQVLVDHALYGTG